MVAGEGSNHFPESCGWRAVHSTPLLPADSAGGGSRTSTITLQEVVGPPRNYTPLEPQDRGLAIRTVNDMLRRILWCLGRIF